MKKLFVIALMCILTFSATYGQDSLITEKAKVETFTGVDLVSRYVWRGTLFDNKPNIQPIVGLAYRNFEVGCFSSLSALNQYYEVDLYASYTMGIFNVTVTDFYMDFSGLGNSQKYFNYKTDTTGFHNITADISFGGTEKFPIIITASTIVYGGFDMDANGDNQYTTYAEVKYATDKYEFFVGGLTGPSAFYLSENENFRIVNVGVTFIREIEITDKFIIPLSSSLMVNPESEKLFLTFIATF